jgi:small-conductance mechanosensitive channel
MPLPFLQLIRRLLNDPMLLLSPLIIFAVTLLAGWVVRRVILRALRAWTTRTDSKPGLILYDTLRRPILIWIAILAAHLAIQGSKLPSHYTAWTSKGLLVLWFLSLTVMSMHIAGNLVRYYGAQVPGALPVTTLTQNLAQLGVLILGIVLILGALDVKITPILTALGVGGLAVALALQDTLSNLFGGFYVAVAGQVRLGDYIRLNTGEEGYVTDIGWRSTSVRALANNLIVIPNSKLAQAIVTNFHLPEKRMGTNLQVGVDYASDPDLVERILLEVAQKGAGDIPGLLAEPAPAVMFDPGFGDSALGFTLLFQVAEFSNQYRVRHELRKRILRRFREEGIGIPFPTRTVYLAGGNNNGA